MNKDFKYDPEDLESLILHKHFSELLQDEREFVLKHIDSETEYEHLRETLMQSITAFNEEEFTPPSALKRDLMNQFNRHHRQQPIWTVWLNSLFAVSKNRPFYLQPVFQLASLSIILVVGGYFLFKQVDVNPVAVEQSQEDRQEIPVETSRKDNVEAETLVEPEVLMEAPAAPKQIDHFVLDQEDSEISETEELAAGKAENAVHFESMAKSIVVEEESFNQIPSFAPAAAGNTASSDMVLSKSQEKPVSVVNESLLDLLFAAR
jgi:hypothetical protein